MPLSKSSLIAVVGSSNTDLVVTTPCLPKPGETILGGQFRRHAGGKGANQAVAAARAGARVLFIGARGDDDFGRLAHAILKREGIDVSSFRVKPGQDSGVALILLGEGDGQNQIVVARSANDALTPADLDSVSTRLSRVSVIVAQLETPLPVVRHAAIFASAHGIPFLLNPAPARKLPVSLLKLVHTLTPNEHESALITGETDPEKSAARLLRMGCRQVVVTLGSEGVLIADANRMRRLPAPKVKVVDTVGAGDCFTGWLALGIAEKLSLDEAVSLALRAASLQVTRPGAQSAMPYRDEIRRD
jgi:ribokinase